MKLSDDYFMLVYLYFMQILALDSVFAKVEVIDHGTICLLEMSL